MNKLQAKLIELFQTQRLFTDTEEIKLTDEAKEAIKEEKRNAIIEFLTRHFNRQLGKKDKIADLFPDPRDPDIWYEVKEIKFE